MLRQKLPRNDICEVIGAIKCINPNFHSMTEKEMFLNSYEKEFQTTLRFLKAYPEGSLNFRPNPHLQSAQELAWSFVQEDQALVSGALEGSIVPKTDPAPDSFSEIQAAYESGHKYLALRIKEFSDDALNEMITFRSDGDKDLSMRRGDALWLGVMDAAHHRGQFSVYIRMVGGKVPALYEPALEPAKSD